MDNLLSVHTVKHGAAVFGIAALVGALAAATWYFLGPRVQNAGTTIASKV